MFFLYCLLLIGGHQAANLRVSCVADRTYMVGHFQLEYAWAVRFTANPTSTRVV